MIIEYHRPQSIQETLELLSRELPVTFAMGGGTYLNRNLDGQYAVVDLQDLNLGQITRAGNQIHIGATTKLQGLLDLNGLPEAVYTSVRRETTYNLRQMMTVAGLLVTANGRSPLASVFLAMDASLEILELDADPKQIRIGDWLPVRLKTKPNKLITKISIPTNINLAYEDVARSPADQPLVCAATAQWKSGRTRLALGGWGDAPMLAMDGPEPGGIEAAATSAYSHAGDEWASAEYRQEMAGVLALRNLQKLNEG